MSASVKSLLHAQATSVAFRPPDLEGIMRGGDQRIRRRRAAATLVTVVAVALAGGTAAAVLGGPTPGDAPPGPGGSGLPNAVSWAVGATIHVGATEEIDVGHEVRAYVRTIGGFVVMDETDVVFAVNEDGTGSRSIGHVHGDHATESNPHEQRLVVNAQGTLAGWVDESVSAGSFAYRVYDPASGQSRDFPAPAGAPEDEVQFYAIDDRTAYWRTPDGIHAVDLVSGDDRQIVAGPAPGFVVYSAANGVLAFSPDAESSVLIGRSVDDATEVFEGTGPPEGHVTRQQFASSVRLSPTGSWLSFALVDVEFGPETSQGNVTVAGIRITPVVVDSVTGERTTLTIPGDPSVAIPSVWLDATTVQVVSFMVGPDGEPTPDTPAVLYGCSLHGAGCQAAAEVAPPLPAFAVQPDGRWSAP
jgi:hypothetical protein